MFDKTKTAILFGVALIAAGSASLRATAITGGINITGSAGVSGVAVDFFGGLGSGCSTAGVGVDGCFLINVPLSGDFSSLPPGVTGGTIKDLQAPPISGAIALASFLTFDNGIVFNLTSVFAGGAPNCASVNGNLANVSCTPYIGSEISPFVLTNSANGTNASVFFNVAVNAYKGTFASGSSSYIGAFNTPSAGKNIAGILADIAAGNTVSAAYSANFIGVEVPEPGTAALFGAGAFALCFGSLLRRRRAVAP